MNESKNDVFTYQEARNFPQIPVPEIERSEIETLYSFSHYDGPCTGLVRWKNRVYFVDNSSFSSSQDRMYWLVDLSDEQANNLLNLAEMYVRYFGNSMLWNPDGTRNTMRQCPAMSPEERKSFILLIDSHRHLLDLPKDSKVLGYFLGWQNLDDEQD